MKIERNVRGLLKDFTCGYCFAQAGYDIAFAEHSEIRSTWGDFCTGRAFAILECRNCKMLNLLVFKVDEAEYGGSMDEFNLGPFLAEHPEIISAGFDREENSIAPTWIELMGQYPYGHKLSNDVPALIKQDLQDAANCIAIGASNAAAIMSRRVIERLAAHLGLEPTPGKMLGATLQELKEEELINDSLYKAFKEVKDWGNIGTHPKKDEEGIGLPEAKKIVESRLRQMSEALSFP